MVKRRAKGDGGLTQRHDHPSCPPRIPGSPDPATGKVTWYRAEHRCQGRWVGTIDVRVDGKVRRKSVYGRTQKQALANLKKALREKDTGTLVVTSTTVEKWLTYWLDSIAARNLKPQTITGYRGYIRHWLIPQMGKRRLADLRPEHIRALHDAMRADGCAEATVRQAHAILKKSLRDAVFEGKLTVSPADRVKSPKTGTKKPPQLTLTEARKVLDAAQDDARWWLALFYGMRQGECLGLCWGHVNFERKTITIESTLQLAEDKTQFFGSPKSDASQRTIPLMPIVEARLKLHYINEGQPDLDTLVFHRPDGRPVDRYQDYKAWKRLLANADAPDVSLHSARGTAASLLEASGVPDRLVAQILGHSQVQITHGYQTADIERMRQAFTSYGEVLELE